MKKESSHTGKVKRLGEEKIEVGPPPIHTHYSEQMQRDELCGRVVCPEGFVGVRVSAPHKEIEPEGWEDTLEKIWSRAHIPEFATDAKFSIEGLIKSLLHTERQKGYEDGYREGVQDTAEFKTSFFGKGFELGKEAAVGYLQNEMLRKELHRLKSASVLWEEIARIFPEARAIKNKDI